MRTSIIPAVSQELPNLCINRKKGDGAEKRTWEEGQESWDGNEKRSRIDIC
jgi:hypothetical protein